MTFFFTNDFIDLSWAHCRARFGEGREGGLLRFLCPTLFKDPAITFMSASFVDIALPSCQSRRTCLPNYVTD